MADFFISYNSADLKKAEWIAWILHEAGYKVRFAPWELPKGGDIAQWMAEALETSRAMICVASPDYIKPQAKYSALERAAMLWQDVDGKQALLIFVKVRDTKLPVIFGARSYIDFAGASRDEAKSLLLDGLKPPTIPETEPEFESESELIAAPANEPDFGPRALLVDTSALPDVSLVTLRGREKELDRLDAAWDDPKTHVLSVVAWGGQGKTALAATWVDRLKAEGGRGAEAILAWSFYSQGSKERAASADRFLDWAMKKLGVPDPGPSANLKAEKIAEALQRRRVLLILDGVEPLQHGPGPQEGQLKDPALRVLLRRAADSGTHGGLVLVTTRLAVKDIERWKETGAPVLDLQKLSDEAGAVLLADRGVKGSDKERRAATRDFGGHALALTLLSGFLVRRFGGDVRRRDRVGPLAAGGGREMDVVHGHARRVMALMDAEWLSGAPLHAAILSTVGLFDRPASADCLQALRGEPTIPGLEAWQAADKAARDDAIFELREAGLLVPEDVELPGALDAHPLVREWFGEKLKQDNQAGWKAAHGRLYEHLRDTTQEGDNPDLIALEPLFQAIPHGCKAGRHREALDEVYTNRICRRDPSGNILFYARNRLGAIGPSLAAIACFFEAPFETPHVDLSASDRSWVLNSAALYLGTLGRLRESIGAQRVTMQMDSVLENWNNAAISAGNLAEVELTVGDVAAATDSAADAVKSADRGGNGFLMIAQRTVHAHVLAVAGDRAVARRMFVDSEDRQTKRDPENARLYSIAGYRYSDLLLFDGAFEEVAERGSHGLEISSRNNWILDIGLDNSSLGRAVLGVAHSVRNSAASKSQMEEVRACLDVSVSELRRSNIILYLPIGLLARACCFRTIGDFSAARRDLDEVEEIAEPGPMRLYLCDMEIERCRLALAERDGFAPLAETLVAPAVGTRAAELTDAANGALAKAAALIERCGYHKRDAERDELQEVLAGKRAFRDLPVRV